MALRLLVPPLIPPGKKGTILWRPEPHQANALSPMMSWGLIELPAQIIFFLFKYAPCFAEKEESFFVLRPGLLSRIRCIMAAFTIKRHRQPCLLTGMLPEGNSLKN